jgi:pyoverdine/dityrosine biosynthesis protein Dit1
VNTFLPVEFNAHVGDFVENQVEVLQVSSLEDYDWPETDPHAVPQRTRLRTERDLQLVRDCLQSAEINMKAFLKDPGKKGLDQADLVLAILSHQKFQMNPVTPVRQEPRWRECVALAISRGLPIDIVYPQFCVIPNAPKRYTNMGSAAGEDCTIEFFKLINRHVQALYQPGLRFHVLADAALYGSAFQTHQTEIDSYYESVQNRIKELGASDCVFLYDYSELMRTKCHPDYQIRYYEIAHQVWKGDPAALLPNTDLPTLRRSVRCSVNNRRLQLKHADHLCLFGPAKWRTADHPYHAIVETMTDIAFKELITIRLACGDIDISTRLWPDAIRATCHKGAKNGRWAVGLKPYPEYYGTCKLLPYHGMPIITKDSKGRPRLEISPEVLLRSREDLVRVTSDGKDEVYAYVAIDLDKELVGEVDYARPLGMRSGEDYPPEAYR